TFARCAGEHDAVAVVVGHTADDVAETLLLHLIRGAGLDGLAAAPLLQELPRAALGPTTDGPALPERILVVRPLLAVARAETAAYCRAAGLVPVAQPDSPYPRDRVRAELLPKLERYNPAARRALARAARALAEERDALEHELGRVWPTLAESRSGGIDLSLAVWTHLPPALRKRAVRRAVATLAGTDEGLGERTLTAALSLASRQSGRGVDLPGGLRLERLPDALRL